MSKKSALGKGMDGLLPIGFDIGAVAEPGEKISQTKIEKVVPNPNQPRKNFDNDSLNELADSIREHGVIQPLIVSTKNKEGEHEIVAGERRWRASKLAGLKTIPIIVRDTQAQQKLEIAIIENVQRVDLNPLEEAMSMHRLKHEFSLSLQEIAKKLGKATTTVSNTMRLMQLTDQAKKALTNNKITEGHARAILSLTDEKEQNKLLNTIITQNYSVREAERAAKQMKSPEINKKPEKLNTKKSFVPTTTSLKQLKELSEKLQSKVNFDTNTSTLKINVENKTQLQEIIKKLSM